MKCEIKTLGELSIEGKGSYGIAASAVEYSPDLYTYLRITDINDDGTIKKDGLKSVADDRAEEYLLQPNDIVFARTGASTGRNYFYDGSDGEFVYAGFLIKFSIDTQKVNPYYIKYFCQSDIYKQWVQSFNTGSTRGNINAKTYSDMQIPLPPRKQQDFLVSILKPIDDKIAANKEINKNLEEQAQLFYKKFDFNCQAWREGTVGEVVTLQRGYDLPKTKMIKGKYPVAGSTDTIFYHNQYMSEPPCIVLGRSGNIGKPRLYLEPCWPHNTSLFTKQFKNSNPLWVYFILYHLDYSMFQGGSAVPTLNRNHIHSYTIKIPPIAEQNKFAQTIEPLIKAIFHNRKEIETLSKLRDTLLPRLMSGEIDVSCVS